MGKLKNMQIENDFLANSSDFIFKDFDYQSKKHFLKERPSRAKFSYVRLLDAIGCVICFITTLFFCLFFLRYVL